ncbi:MAG: hypothetical protein IJS47_02415 [Clostridia bacterium]|nr:hypothetical protein [Clostridia bacterium]
MRELKITNGLSLEEKIKIFEKYITEIGEKITIKTVYELNGESYPIGQWKNAISSRYIRGLLVFTDEQKGLEDRLIALGIINRDRKSQKSNFYDIVDTVSSWIKRYPNTLGNGKSVDVLIEEYAKRYDEDFEELKKMHEHVVNNYRYLTNLRARGALSKEKIDYCRDNRIGGVFGASDEIIALSEKYRLSVNTINLILAEFGSMDDFMEKLRGGKIPKEELDRLNIKEIKCFNIDGTAEENLDEVVESIFGKKDFRDLRFCFYDKEALYRAVEELPDARMKEAYKSFYGIGCEPETMTEVAKKFPNISRTRVEQLVYKASTLLHKHNKNDIIVYSLPKKPAFTPIEEAKADELLDIIYGASGSYYPSTEYADTKSELVGDKSFISTLKYFRERYKADMIKSMAITSTTKIENLDVSIKTSDALDSLGIKVLGDLAGWTPQQIMDALGDMSDRSRNDVLVDIKKTLSTARMKMPRDVNKPIYIPVAAKKHRTAKSIDASNIMDVALCDIPGLYNETVVRLNQYHIDYVKDLCAKTEEEIRGILSKSKKVDKLIDDIEYNIFEPYDLAFKRDAQEKATDNFGHVEIGLDALKASKEMLDTQVSELKEKVQEAKKLYEQVSGIDLAKEADTEGIGE